MIRPLAGADAPGEVVGVFSKDRTAERDYRPFSYPGFSDVRDAGGPFAHLAGHTVALAGVIENHTTRQATVDIVTTGFFETLGVQPVYGRDFPMEEERPGTPARSVIVSYKVWERSGLDRDILKQTVRINGQDFAIVGVAPQHFTGTTAILGAEYAAGAAAPNTKPVAEPIPDSAAPKQLKPFWLDPGHILPKSEARRANQNEMFSLRVRDFQQLGRT